MNSDGGKNIKKYFNSIEKTVDKISNYFKLKTHNVIETTTKYVISIKVKSFENEQIFHKELLKLKFTHDPNM